jgi:hypothetical protein
MGREEAGGCGYSFEVGLTSLEEAGAVLRASAFFFLCVSGEVGGGDGDGGDSCGFGTEDAGAEGDRLPSVSGEERHLFGGPSAFWAYGQGVGDFKG